MKPLPQKVLVWLLNFSSNGIILVLIFLSVSTVFHTLSFQKAPSPLASVTQQHPLLCSFTVYSSFPAPKCVIELLFPVLFSRSSFSSLQLPPRHR